MDVSIIIVNYNTKSITKACIESVIEQTKKVNYEIILVDNNSKDGSVDLFSSDKRINFIASKENVGFGRANNLGYKIAKGKYIFLLNSDTILLNDAVSMFYSKMETAPENIACIGGYLLNKELRPNQSYGRFLYIRRVLKMAIDSYARKLYTRHKEYDYWGRHEDWMEVEMVIGADLFIKRDVIDKLGLFDETFFMYHEENDLQRRFYINGYKAALVIGPQIIHLEQASSAKSAPMKKKIMGDMGMFNYMRIWLAVYEFYFFKTLYLMLKLPILLENKYSFKDRCRYLQFLLSMKYKRKIEYM